VPSERFSGQVAVVTGGASGIGAAICSALAEEGARVALLDIDEAGGTRVAEGIRAAGGDAAFIPCDVSDADTVAAAFAAVDDRFGVPDVLVNDAFFGSHTKPTEIGVGEWGRVLAVNLTGTFLCSQQAARRMIERGTGGAIVNLSSIAGTSALGRGNFAYSVSKGGVDALTRELAIEWAPHRVRVNAIKPCQTMTPGLEGLIADPQFDSDTLLATWLRGIPLNELPTARDMAAAVLFLASDDARMITGVLLPVDGGNLAMNPGGTVVW
jgi:NAD(P)-dependent dehydrogenase (short-subunit alcohol dehydrogenase family)